MNKKAYIFGFLDFPRGSASANYVQYLALCLKSIGYTPVIISNGNKELCEVKDSKLVYKDIIVELFELNNSKVKNYIDFHFGIGNIVTRKLKKLNLKKGDLVIAYSINCFDFIKVFKYAKEKEVTTIACIPEFFTEQMFKYGKFDWRYWSYNYTMKRSILTADKILPISTYIEKIYKSYNCDTLCLPIMADTKEFEYKKKVRSDKKRRIIFPANGAIKDSIISMLKSFTLLTEQELDKLEFHITGINKSYIYENLEAKELDRIEDIIVLHKWMDYEELISLYQKMDFLLLARETNQMTLANFPSKVPEVMGYGVVPIVSRVGDYTKYYLTDGRDSIIFDGYNEHACINAIRRALSLSDEQLDNMELFSRKCAEEKFDYRVWKEKIRKFIEY